MPDNIVTKERIKEVSKTAQYYVFPGSATTVCCLTLQNGYKVLGESHCVDETNYDQRQGEGYALEDAMKKVWQLEGYLLKQKLFLEKGPDWP